MKRKLAKRSQGSGKNVITFSERSGLPYPHNEMILEPGTGVLIHRSESDGDYNRAVVYIDPLVPPDAQTIKYPRGNPLMTAATSLYLTDEEESDPLYVDILEQDALVYEGDFY